MVFWTCAPAHAPMAVISGGSSVPSHARTTCSASTPTRATTRPTSRGITAIASPTTRPAGHRSCLRRRGAGLSFRGRYASITLRHRAECTSLYLGEGTRLRGGSLDLSSAPGASTAALVGLPPPRSPPSPRHRSHSPTADGFLPRHRESAARFTGTAPPLRTTIFRPLPAPLGLLRHTVTPTPRSDVSGRPDCHIRRRTACCPLIHRRGKRHTQKPRTSGRRVELRPPFALDPRRMAIRRPLGRCPPGLRRPATPARPRVGRRFPPRLPTHGKHEPRQVWPGVPGFR